MLRLSTGLRNSLASSYGIYPQMSLGVIYVYSGTPPASPDLAMNPNGALAEVTTEGRHFIANIDPNNAGLDFLFASPGILLNKGLWVLTAFRPGTATWFRWHGLAADSNEDSTVFPRIDGSVGDVLVLQDPVIRADTVRPIDSFMLQIPMGN